MKQASSAGEMGESAFNDHFSKHAAEYAKFRPRYPKELIQWLGSVSPAKKLAWDCATGSGQAAIELANAFEHIMATDGSEKQVGNAEQHPRVEYRIATAEESGRGCAAGVVAGYGSRRQSLMIQQATRLARTAKMAVLRFPARELF